jgi:hypothetical protein
MRLEGADEEDEEPIESDQDKSTMELENSIWTDITSLDDQ